MFSVYSIPPICQFQPAASTTHYNSAEARHIVPQLDVTGFNQKMLEPLGAC